LADPVATLVQGDAVVVEALDPLSYAMRGLAAVAARRQPDSSQFSANPIARRLFAWYLFQRLIITVTPRRLLVWPHRDFSHAPTVITLDTPETANAPADTLGAPTLATVPATPATTPTAEDTTASVGQQEGAPDVE
jgi:hypothetical protein